MFSSSKRINNSSNYGGNQHPRFSPSASVLASCYATSGPSASAAVQGFHYSSTGANGLSHRPPATCSNADW